MTTSSAQRGFTLIEMVVSVALFSIVMVICVGALLSLTTANRKAQALQSVVNNLNVAIDGMVRQIREGTMYDGSVACASNAGGAKDCTGGGAGISFRPYGATTNWIYRWDNTTGGTLCGKNAICVTKDNGTNWYALTAPAPEVNIVNLTFFVAGTAPLSDTPGDAIQPKVVIVIQGTAGAQGVNSATPFHIQATAVQRQLDI